MKKALKLINDSSSKPTHRLDEYLENKDYMEAIDQTLRPLKGLREILSRLINPNRHGPEVEGCLNIISASLDDLDYVIKKWRAS